MRSVLILECLDKGDPGSEGRFTTHMLSLMGIKNQYIQVETKEQFVALLRTAPSQAGIIHITTHGRCSKNAFHGFWTPEGDVQTDDLEEVRLSGKTIISTACLSGQLPFARRFQKVTSCRHYVAPQKSPRFHNAIMFSHLSYHNHFILKKNVDEAFGKYKTTYKNPHDFHVIKSRARR